MGKKQANKKPETVPIDQISIWAQKHSWDSFLRMSAVFHKSGVQKKVEETIGIFLGTVFKYMKMTLTWYKGDDISHQQPVTIRRKQTARKPRQWVAMKAWLEGASQNKNQDSWCTTPESLKFDYPNEKKIKWKKNSLLALLPQQLVFRSLVGTQLLGQISTDEAVAGFRKSTCWSNK